MNDTIANRQEQPAKQDPDRMVTVGLVSPSETPVMSYLRLPAWLVEELRKKYGSPT